MKLCFSFIVLFLFLTSSKNQTDEIVGEYYSNIYSCGDMKKDLSLVQEIPEEYATGKTPHKDEYDVMWKFNFHENGEIEIMRMFEYYCGNIAILEKGKWSKTKRTFIRYLLKENAMNSLLNKRKNMLLSNWKMET